MTTTDRAFIKAYRQDAAEPAQVIPPMRLAARAATVGVDAMAASSTAETSARSKTSDLPPSASQTVSGQSHRATLRGERQPLSQFIAEADDRRERHPVHEETAFLEPGTIVASFNWPPVCRALTRCCAPQLDSVADALWRKARPGQETAAAGRLIGVLGLFAGGGATTVAMALAARLAAGGRRHILVDANFTRPRIAEWLDIAPTAHWQEVLQHRAPLADALVRAPAERLDLLALGASPQRVAVCDKRENLLRMVGGLQAVVTAGVLRHAYDITLLDLGPYFDPAHQPILLKLVRNMGLDAVVAVAGPDSADERDLETISAQLDSSGCELLGTIENRTASPLNPTLSPTPYS